MGVIASGELDLSSVNDAYQVLLSNPVCVIQADYGGEFPGLDNAFTYVEVKSGGQSLAFEMGMEVYGGMPVIATCKDVSGNKTRWQIAIQKVTEDATEGQLPFHVDIGRDYTMSMAWSYSIIREAGMLDWVKDWDNNKTKIGDSYVITPKLFVGQKIEVNEDGQITSALTGVYIGPDKQFVDSAGIYGFKQGNEIFHLNEEGGFIGGWSIEDGGIQTQDGNLKILSEGTIEARNEAQDLLWGIYKTGKVTFAKGNVQFNEDGSASFAGTITATDGKVGGWSILSTSIEGDHIALDSANKAIGVFPGSVQSVILAPGQKTSANVPSLVKIQGGVAMYYESANSYGLIGYIPGVQKAKKVLAIGSENLIAGWQLDDTALWIGERNNTYAKYTTSGITIGTNGIRGMNFYLDSTGAAGFAGGKFTIANDGQSQIAGWAVKDHSLSSKYAALTSNDTHSGLYLTIADISNRADYIAAVQKEGGVYVYRGTDEVTLGAYNTEGSLEFMLSSKYASKIAGWYFNGAALYTGSPIDVSGSFTSASAHMTLGANGLRGYKWQLNADGSGKLAGGLIEWTNDGKITIGYDGHFTIVEGNTLYTGTINANQITTGTIDAKNISADTIISNGDFWALNKDGSGYLANKKISWDKDGNLTVTEIKATQGTIGGFQISADHIGLAKSNTTSDAASKLSIYGDFFAVGGATGWARFGNNLMPSSSVAAYSCVSEIENHRVATDPVMPENNYGIIIDVTGGTRNIGIKSNAAIQSPANISTGIKIVNITNTSYDLDFAQYSAFILNYTGSQSSITIDMPTEQAIADRFGYSSTHQLPDDFALIVRFIVPQGYKSVTLPQLGGGNGKSYDYTLGAGNSLELLISKADPQFYHVLAYYR